eukprot:SAG11_NODE_96_length_17016_cov_18.755113_2_plen_227_part_00
MLEVYTAEDAFQLQLPAGDEGAPSEDKHPAKLWKIEPGHRKTVIQLTFESAEPTRVAGYIHIRTDKDTFVIAVDVKVMQGQIVATPASIDFGTITTTPGRSAVAVKLLNAHATPVRIVNTDCDPPFFCSSGSGSSAGGRNGSNIRFTHVYTERNGVIEPGEEIQAMVPVFNAADTGEFIGVVHIHLVSGDGNGKANDDAIKHTVAIPFIATGAHVDDASSPPALYA